MRASDLLGLPVVGPQGQSLGKVLDIRLVQDGPLLGAYAALRIDGFVVGHRGGAARLGYDRYDVQGPALLRALVRWWTRGNRFLPWAMTTLRDDRLEATTSTLDQVPSIA